MNKQKQTQENQNRLLVTLNEEDLKRLIQVVISEQLIELLPNKSKKNIKPKEFLVPRMKLAEYFGVSLITIDKWKKFGILPKPKKIGGRIYYLESELNLCLQKQ